MNDIFDIILKFDRYLVWTTEIHNTNRYDFNKFIKEINLMENRLNNIDNIVWEISIDKVDTNYIKLMILFKYKKNFYEINIDFKFVNIIMMTYDNIIEIDKNGVIIDDITDQFNRYAIEIDNQFMI